MALHSHYIFLSSIYKWTGIDSAPHHVFAIASIISRRVFTPFGQAMSVFQFIYQDYLSCFKYSCLLPNVFRTKIKLYVTLFWLIINCIFGFCVLLQIYSISKMWFGWGLNSFNKIIVSIMADANLGLVRRYSYNHTANLSNFQVALKALMSKIV